MLLSPRKLAPESGKADRIAKSVNDDTRPNRCCSHINESCQPAEDRGIAELKDRAEYSWKKRRVRMSQSKFVVVVYMGDAEVERRQKHDVDGWDLRQQMNWYQY